MIKVADGFEALVLGGTEASQGVWDDICSTHAVLFIRNTVKFRLLLLLIFTHLIS